MNILFITDNKAYVSSHVKRLLIAGHKVWLENRYKDAEDVLNKIDIDKILITDYVPCGSNDPIYEEGHRNNIPTIETFLKKNESVLTGKPICFMHFVPKKVEGIKCIDMMSVSDIEDFLNFVESL